MNCSQRHHFSLGFWQKRVFQLFCAGSCKFFQWFYNDSWSIIIKCAEHCSACRIHSSCPMLLAFHHKWVTLEKLRKHGTCRQALATNSNLVSAKCQKGEGKQHYVSTHVSTHFQCGKFAWLAWHGYASKFCVPIHCFPTKLLDVFFSVFKSSKGFVGGKVMECFEHPFDILLSSPHGRYWSYVVVSLAPLWR